jgi:hypothetical protein
MLDAHEAVFVYPIAANRPWYFLGIFLGILEHVSSIHFSGAAAALIIGSALRFLKSHSLAATEPAVAEPEHQSSLRRRLTRFRTVHRLEQH